MYGKYRNWNYEYYKHKKGGSLPCPVEGQQLIRNDVKLGGYSESLSSVWLFGMASSVVGSWATSLFCAAGVWFPQLSAEIVFLQPSSALISGPRFNLIWYVSRIYL